MSHRGIKTVLRGRQVTEGAGVRLRRLVGLPELDHVDPFLLLDEFRSDDPGDYIAGFPWHPHRGIETVTYMIEGQVRHGDSLGNSGVIGPGDVQWMTAGRGIIHEEMPEQRNGLLWGFQLWVNLPARDKMCAPRYQDVSREQVPVVQADGGALVRVVAGHFGDVVGPVTEIDAAPLYVDVELPAESATTVPLQPGHAAFCHLFDGAARIADQELKSPMLVLLSDEGDRVALRTGPGRARALVVAGAPLREPIARGGPFVMNTREEIEQAYRELREGTFLDPPV